MVNRRNFLKIAGLGFLTYPGFLQCIKKRKQPNVLFIIWDDQNDLVSLMQDPSVKTPNLERFAKKGLFFNHAYCSAPACGPSRASLITGILPSTSGIYYNSQCNQKDLSNPIWDAISLPRHFMENGYISGVYGKVFHAIKKYDPERYKQYTTPGFYRPFLGFWGNIKIEDMTGNTDFRKWGGSNFVWGAYPEKTSEGEPYPPPEDVQHADAVIDVLKQKHDKPFFLALGICRPHLPWIVPKKYFDLYPIEQVEIPKGYKENDLDDVPPPGKWIATQILKGTHDAIVRENKWKEALQAYHASTSFADDQLGRVLDALESSPYAKDTIVLFCCDHGYHHGEKEHWTKFTLWEKSNHVPFIAYVPGLTPHGQECPSPISLLDMYPTLISLCGLPKPETHTLEGVDISPLFKNPDKKRGRPVLSTYGYNNHSLRDERYRYIRYRNGDEELYDHENDPYEWTNLAQNPEYDSVKKRLARYLPEKNVPAADDGGNLGWEDEAFE